MHPHSSISSYKTKIYLFNQVDVINYYFDVKIRIQIKIMFLTLISLFLVKLGLIYYFLVNL